ncbi:MAG: phosphotransferase [Rhodobacteraceae bacterium]|nr:phosphotransferase [Paracoccaceae bacterium]
MSMAEAQAALAAWGPADVVRLIKDRENAVFEVRLATGVRAALRLHRSGYQSTDAIRSELWWMGALADRGFPAPRPLPAAGGVLVAEREGERAASLLEWVEGAPIGAGGVALVGTPGEIAQRHRALGALVARLHAVTDRLARPAWFTRPAWDADAFLGAEPFWGPFWRNPALSRSEAELLLQARATARQALSELEASGADMGLIHADLLRENVMQRPDGSLALIDFDDCGPGFRLYDLATALSQSVGEPGLADRAEALLEGYAADRAPGAGAAAALPLLLMLRLCAACGWQVPRAGGDRARLRRVAVLAVAAARGWLHNGGWPAALQE